MSDCVVGGSGFGNILVFKALLLLNTTVGCTVAEEGLGLLWLGSLVRWPVELRPGTG